jgi:hypothetical protein
MCHKYQRYDLSHHQHQTGIKFFIRCCTSSFEKNAFVKYIKKLKVKNQSEISKKNKRKSEKLRFIEKLLKSEK